MTEQSAAVARIASIANLFDKRRAAVGINVARLELAQMVESSEAELAQLCAALAQALAELDAATRRAEQAEERANDLADAIGTAIQYASGRAESILRAALAGPEGGPR